MRVRVAWMDGYNACMRDVRSSIIRHRAAKAVT